MNDFERKLRETPLRQPPAQLRDEILGMPAAEPVAGNNQSARTSSETSPQRWFGEADESRARGKARPLLGVLLKPSSIFCIFIATVMTGATALFVGANSAGKSSWERYSDEARARGVKMSLKDLLPAPIPDAENFAAVPLFANLFSEDEAVRKMAGDALACGFPEQPKDARSTAMGAPRYSLSDWQTFFVKSGDISTATADPAADVLRALEHRFGPHLAELAEAERRPHAVFPVKWELGFMAGLPHLSVIQSAAKIHRIRLAAYLAQGNTAEALAELRGMLRLYRALEKEPTMISGLVRVSVLKLAVSEVWEGVVTAAWDAAALEKIEDDLAGFNLLADCQLAFASERAGINDALESALSGQ